MMWLTDSGAATLFLIFILVYTVQCTLYSVQYIQYSIQYTSIYPMPPLIITWKSNLVAMEAEIWFASPEVLEMEGGGGSKDTMNTVRKYR